MSRIMGFVHDRVERAGHAVDYLCSEDAPPYAQGRRTRFGFPRFVRSQVLRAAQSGTPYDIVNVHEPSSASVATRREGLGGASVVVTSHGLEERAWTLALEEGRLGRNGPRLLTRLTFPGTVLRQARAGIAAADHVFCLNNEDRDFLIERYGRAASSVTRMTPGATETFARTARARDYRTATRILFAGTWRTNKGIADLVAAFTDIAGRHPTAELQILGAGMRRDAVESAFNPSVRFRVRCVEAGTEEETAAVFAAADIFLLPSLFEGTPLTLMEAMMSGLPIVTTATCGMKDIIVDQRNGLLVPIRSPRKIVGAIDALLADERLRESLGQAAQSDAQTLYPWDVVARPVLEVYEKLREVTP
jgi:glycosyltransferase involved in cell wall biosynthesis